MRRNYCQACSFARFGVKTRIHVEHTCDERIMQVSFGLKETMETNEFPRRQRLDLMSPAEKAIQEAVWEVEKIGADVSLTEAVILLQKAKGLVSDYVDKNP